MHYALTSTPTLHASECLVLGLFENHPLPEFAAALDKKQQGLITRLFSKCHKAGDTAWQTDVEGHGLLIIHCGDMAKFTTSQLTKRLTEINTLLLKARLRSAIYCMPPLSEHSADWQVQHMLLRTEEKRYQLLDYKTKDNTPHPLNAIVFFQPGSHQKTITIATAIAESIEFTRTLANLPANVCTPSYLSQQAVQLAQKHDKLQTTIKSQDDICALGMGALHAVAKGSVEPAQFIEIHYVGAPADTPPIVLVGKGITFDSGGLSLKPADAMAEMKYDMAGAASVLGTLKACALLNLPLHVVGLIPSAENMPSGTAVKPGDIITSMSGQTVEIINTDAEGRLILADALTYAERFKPQFVIDIATLTGAVIVALGSVSTGLMTTDDALAELILNAAKESDDKTWRLPLSDDYQEALESPLADMLNATFDRTAGSVTAACFLSRFTHQYRWAHLDVAGTAWVSGKKRNATGRPVPLLIQLLRHVADSR